MKTSAFVTALRERKAELEEEIQKIDQVLTILVGYVWSTSDPASMPTAKRRKPRKVVKKKAARANGRYKYRGMVRSVLVDVLVCWDRTMKPTWNEVISHGIAHARELHHRRIPLRVMRQGMHTLKHEGIIAVDPDGIVTLKKRS